MNRQYSGGGLQSLLHLTVGNSPPDKRASTDLGPTASPAVGSLELSGRQGLPQPQGRCWAGFPGGVELCAPVSAQDRMTSWIKDLGERGHPLCVLRLKPLLGYASV